MCFLHLPLDNIKNEIIRMTLNCPWTTTPQENQVWAQNGAHI